MKKKAIDLEKGDKVVVGGKNCEVTGVESSEIGKQGKKKVRLELKDPEGDKVVIIRPEDYPFEEA